MFDLSTVAQVQTALRTHPTLGGNGFHCRHETPHRWCRSLMCAWEPTVFAGRKSEDLEYLRRPTSIDRICAVAEWIGQYPQTKTVTDRSPDSYGLKHRAEIYLRDDPRVRGYVSNGELIAAALAVGLHVRRDGDGGPNAAIGLRRRDYKRMYDETNAMKWGPK